MKWIEIFNIYDLKQMKKEKRLFFFTIVTILIATTISLTIPQVNLENRKYIEKNIKEINGGDLSINLRENSTKKFNEKIEELKNSEIDVKKSTISNCYYKKDSNNIIGTIVVGDYSLNNDEIILQSSLANTLNVKKGDTVEFDTNGNGKFKYKVKDIEPVSSGVDRDTELKGYGKVQEIKELKEISGYSIIHINGRDGEALKEELFKLDDGNQYTTLEDKRLEMHNTISMQNVVLGILSTIGYIFSILAIISTTIMIILKRKRDISILRMLSIDRKKIKKALRAEITLWLLAPILLSGIFSYFISKLILGYSGIIINGISKEVIIIIIKGMFFNSLVFLILINISLSIVQGISPMSAIREDEKDLKKQNKKIIILTIILVPIFLVAYAFYNESIENIGSSLIVIFLIIFFLGLVSLVIKILSLAKFKNKGVMYCIKSIKSRFLSFVLVILSLTLTLSFILIGFNLEKSIKENYKGSLEEILPYNYYATSKDNISLEKVINENRDVEGYIKYSEVEGKVNNENFNKWYRSIVIGEINKEDYRLKFNINEGKNLFEGEEGLIISDNMKERNNLKIGDTLEIETYDGIIKGKIKGVYESGGINTMAIFKENREISNEMNYFIKSSTSEFIDSLQNSTVTSIGDLGDMLVSNIVGFLNIFRILFLICLFGTILFNINIVYMSFISEDKDYEVLIALGLGQCFIKKIQPLKIILVICLSSILSLGVYTISIKMFFKMMVNSSGKVSGEIIFINIILSIIISIISFIFPIRRLLKKKELNLLREGD